MNYIVLIISVVILFGVADLLTVQYPRLQKQLYYIAISITYFLFVIRYYYGPDIASYVPFYENPPTLNQILNPDISLEFEKGYALFNLVCYRIGLDYWGMTAIITTLYFIAIALLFRLVPSNRSFGLMVLIALDYALIYAQNRQCLAVSFFIFSVLLLRNKRFLWAILCAVICFSMHKSAPFVLLLTFIYFFVRRLRAKEYVYQIILFVLIIMVFVPVGKISSNLISALPFSSSIIASLQHHFMLGTNIQVIVLLYASVLICIQHLIQYGDKRSFTWISYIAFLGIVITICFYQYYFILNRIRSYFLPFIIVYVLQMVHSSTQNKAKHIPYFSLLRQTVAIIALLFSIHSVFSFYRMSKKISCPLHKTCTIFNLIDTPSWAVKNQQMKIAKHFWENDYMKENTNKL